MTETCCLDCVAKCKDYNCRDYKPPLWCHEGDLKDFCGGNCKRFVPAKEAEMRTEPCTFPTGKLETASCYAKNWKGKVTGKQIDILLSHIRYDWSSWETAHNAIETERLIRRMGRYGFKKEAR